MIVNIQKMKELRVKRIEGVIFKIPIYESIIINFEKNQAFKLRKILTRPRIVNAITGWRGGRANSNPSAPLDVKPLAIH